MSDETRPIAIGIDLGTTNCTLAFARGKDDTPEPLGVSQVIAAGEVTPRPLLPSFLYFPADSEFAAGALALPWYGGARDVVGTFARKQGASTPARLVSSAKSWLSHASVDRRGEILPWGSPDEVPKVSPLQASARYLAHLRAAWDEENPESPLAEQDVVLTVPASFDAVARELTMEAAELAGFEEPPRLLEEPQAAMYDWLAQRGSDWRQDVAVGDHILVIDVGGGTTDFSLIAVREEDGELQLERIAVGDHILLGGDNMDLALAHTVRARLESEGVKLDDWQMRAMTHACRGAKEALLGDNPESSYPLAIAGRGSKLIGGTVRTELTLAELERVILDGFFPVVNADDRTQAPRRAGLTVIGLPYAADAAMTRHLAAFLGRSASASASEGDETRPTFVHPTAILFNGGVTQSPRIRDRICDVLGSWLEAEGGSRPRILQGSDAELAVSRGAAYYAQARRHGGLRIRGGTAQAHYIGIERAELAVPGIPPRVDAVCVAPFGMEEGSEVNLDQAFGLVLGEPVSFRFFGSTSRKDDMVGAVVDPSDLTELSPIETTLEGTDGQVVHVRLHARVTEVGTLELSAVEEGTSQRWKLSFNVRVA
ncbi:MAG: Hsp70 family protein [Nannocystaceae bacterium]|nr:Hsp70 family protein [Nannocystaceae bacterium]